jgi:site-specific recombinase XerD
MPPELAIELKIWHRENGKAPFVLTYRDEGMEGYYFLKLFKRILRNAQITGTFHMMRHTYASNLVNAGVDLYTIAKLLGHASVKTTEIYAHLQTESLRKAVLTLATLPTAKVAKKALTPQSV